MKTTTVNKAFSEILESIDHHDLINSYFGGSNITASYLNDYSADSINEFIGNWLDENLNKEWMQSVELSAGEVINNPDCILQQAGNEFFISICAVLPDAELKDVEEIFNDSCKFFNAYGDYYIYADNWSNACTNWYIIRASNNEEAINDLITIFEAHFIIENEDYEDYDLINDNGNHVDIDNLQLIGCIKTSE